MKELSIYEYISTRNIIMKNISFEDDLNNKISYTKFNDIYIMPKLWSVITKGFYIFTGFERYRSTYKHQKEILLRQNEIKKNSKLIIQNKGNFFYLVEKIITGILW